MDKYSFQYCQKIAVLSKDGNSILLCKRQEEKDYDGVFSLIGGKMESDENSILDALKREKDEEVGENFIVDVFDSYSFNVFWRKGDGTPMILPHYLAWHVEGEIKLSDEYSEYKWVSLEELDSFEPKISNISPILKELLKLPKENPKRI